MPTEEKEHLEPGYSLLLPSMPSCSTCLTRSEPPTKAIAHTSRSWRRCDIIVGDALRRAGVSVPSTSNMQMVVGSLRSAKGLTPAGNLSADMSVLKMEMKNEEKEKRWDGNVG